MIFGEVTLGFFRVFLLIDPFGHPEHLIYKTMESVAVPCLVLSLGVKNTDAIQGTFKFTRLGPVLLVASWSFHHVDGMICFPLFVIALGRARLVCVAQLLLLLLLSCVKRYLLSQGIPVSDDEANIASDVLGFFMASLRIKDGSQSPFLKNITMDLSLTSGMMFLLL
jgi:hypothetical protein